MLRVLRDKKKKIRKCISLVSKYTTVPLGMASARNPFAPSVWWSERGNLEVIPSFKPHLQPLNLHPLSFLSSEWQSGPSSSPEKRCLRGIRWPY